jgi:hypothetical protein
MKKMILVFSIVLMIPLMFVGHSHAAVIGYSEGGSTRTTTMAPTYSSVEISPWYSSSWGYPKYAPFGTITIGSAFVGDVWTADSASSDFANAVLLLTNGVWDILGHDNLTLLGGNASAEAITLQGPGFKNPDFQGSIINKMTLLLDYYSSAYVPTYDWINDEGDTTTLPAYVTEYKYTIIYESAEIQPVPEPATMLLLGFGLAGLAGMKRKIKKS